MGEGFGRAGLMGEWGSRGVVSKGRGMVGGPRWCQMDKQAVAHGCVLLARLQFDEC